MKNTSLTDVETSLRSAGLEADLHSDANPEASSAPAVETPAATHHLPQPSAPEDKPEPQGAHAPEDPAAGSDHPSSSSPEYDEAVRHNRPREARAWKDISQRKAELAAREARLEAAEKAAEKAAKEAAQHAESATTVPRPLPAPDAPSLKDEHGFTAADYERAAEGFDKEGNASLAEAAKARAAALSGREQASRQEAHLARIRAGIDAVIAERQEFKDPASDAGKAVIAILNEHPEWKSTVHGFKAAVALYDSRKAAAASSDLQRKYDALAKENERLVKLTTLPASNPGNAPREKTFDQLSDRDQERQLRRLAAQVDSEG